MIYHIIVFPLQVFVNYMVDLFHLMPHRLFRRVEDITWLIQELQLWLSHIIIQHWSLPVFFGRFINFHAGIYSLLQTVYQLLLLVMCLLSDLQWMNTTDAHIMMSWYWLVRVTFKTLIAEETFMLIKTTKNSWINKLVLLYSSLNTLFAIMT